MNRAYSPEEFQGASDWFYVLKCLFYYYATILGFVYLGRKIEEWIKSPIVIHNYRYFYPWCEVNPNAKNVSKFWKDVDCKRCIGKRK